MHDVLIIVLLKLIHCVYSVVVLSLDLFLVLIAILFSGKSVTWPHISVDLGSLQFKLLWHKDIQLNLIFVEQLK